MFVIAFNGFDGREVRSQRVAIDVRRILSIDEKCGFLVIGRNFLRGHAENLLQSFRVEIPVFNQLIEINALRVVTIEA